MDQVYKKTYTCGHRVTSVIFLVDKYSTTVYLDFDRPPCVFLGEPMTEAEIDSAIQGLSAGAKKRCARCN